MSSGDALTGAENRCEPTTWMMSPAVMYSLAPSTLAKNFSCVCWIRTATSPALRPARHGMMFARLFEQRNEPLDFADAFS
jgi:hypothetical protein